MMLQVKYFLISIALALSASAHAQQQSFKYEVPLNVPDSTAFYTIKLQPSLVSRCRPDLADLRIMDAQRKFIPYIFGSTLPSPDTRRFLGFKLSTRSKLNDSTQVLTAENQAQLSIDELVLRIRNTAVERVIDLSGSNDQRSWYAVEENLVMAKSGVSTGDVFEQQLHFPLNRYRYFRVTIHNHNREPLAILQAGVYEHTGVLLPVYISLPGVLFHRLDTSTVTRISLSCPQSYQVNQLKFQLGDSHFFRRRISVYEVYKMVETQIADTVLLSSPKGGQPSIDLFSKSKNLLIEIDNGDNPPLPIEGVKAYQLETSVISYLVKGHPYKILLGDSAAQEPHYDLAYFTDSLHQSLSSLGYGPLTPNRLYHPASHTVKTHTISTALLWTLLLGVILVLGAFTLNLTREVKRSEPVK